MNQPDDHLLLFQRRTLGELLDVPFDFLRHQRHAWLLWVALPLLLLSLLLALGGKPLDFDEEWSVMNILTSRIMGFDFHTGSGFFSIETLLVALALCWVLWTVHALMRCVQRREDATTPAMAGEVRRLAPRALAFFVLAYLVLRLFNDGGASTAFLLILLCLPVAVLPPACMLRDMPFGDMLSHALTVAVRKWLALLLVVPVMGFLVFMLQGAMQLPAALLENVVNTFTMADERPATWILFLQFLTTMLSWWVFFVGFSFQVIAVAYVYGDGAERTDEVSLSEAINNFENL